MKDFFTIADSFIIKGIAILMLLVHHCFLDARRWGSCPVDFFPLTEKLTVSIAVECKICVAIFLFITAYGLTVKIKKLVSQNSSFTDFSYVRFILQRIYKLYLNFWVIFLLALGYSFVMGLGHFTKTYGRGKEAFGKFAIDFLGMANMMHTPTFNGTWWYMSLVLGFIIAFPLLYAAYQKFGFLLFPALILLPSALNLPYSSFISYLACAYVGVVFADKGYFGNLQTWQQNASLSKKFAAFISSILLLVICFYILAIFKKVCGYKAFPFVLAIEASLVIAVAFTFVKNKYLQCLLHFLGKHSMNIFFVHTLIRHYWYHDFIYSFHNAWLIVLVLLLISLAISFVIEFIKKLVRFEKILDFKI